MWQGACVLTTTSSTATFRSACWCKRSNIADFVASPAHGARAKKPSIALPASIASVLPVDGSDEKIHANGHPCFDFPTHKRARR